jgi:4'-phosphopantetheinyl transferase EntD
LSETVLAFDCDLLAARFSAVAGAPVFVAGGGFVSEPSPYPEEQQLVARAVAKRQVEFFSGRYFARAALSKAGGPSAVILRGEKGNPLWPPGFTGAITHDGQQAIAIVTRIDSLLGLGVDFLACAANVEPHLQSLIATDAELSVLAKLYPAIPPLALAFSLKEAVVKAVSPRIDHYLDLMNIRLISQGENCCARVLDVELPLDCIGFEATSAIVTFASLSR